MAHGGGLAFVLLALVNFIASALAGLHVCAQRVLVTGRCCHSEIGRRDGILLSISQVFGELCNIIILVYEANRAGLLGPAFASSPMPCTAVFIASHLTPSLYAAPYILRGLRLVAKFDTGMRARLRWFTQRRCGN